MRKIIEFVGAFALTAFALTTAQASTVLYETQFPTSSFGGPCSPCGSDYRHYDLINLGSTNTTLTGIDFAVHDITVGGAKDINVSIFDTSENLLFSTTQTDSLWTKSSVIDHDNYTVSFSLPGVSIVQELVYVSIFGVNGTSLALFGASGGDGVAVQMVDTTPSGFAGSSGFRPSNNVDVAMRIYGNTTVVPLPAALPLLLSGIGVLGFARLRTTSRTS